MFRVFVTAQTRADLDGATYLDGDGIILMGNVTPLDVMPRLYYYDANSTATPDNNWIIQPLLVTGSGRFIRINIQDSVVDSTSVSYTKSIINSTYPNIPSGYSVICPIIFTKYTKYDATNWFSIPITILP